MTDRVLIFEDLLGWRRWTWLRMCLHVGVDFLKSVQLGLLSDQFTCVRVVREVNDPIITIFT